jgi:hypothetical protein
LEHTHGDRQQEGSLVTGTRLVHVLSTDHDAAEKEALGFDWGPGVTPIYAAVEGEPLFVSRSPALEGLRLFAVKVIFSLPEVER